MGQELPEPSIFCIFLPNKKKKKRSVVGASIEPAPDQRSGSLSYPKIRITRTLSMCDPY